MITRCAPRRFSDAIRDRCLDLAPALANTPASSSKQAAQATSKGLLRLLCADDAENVNQPGFSVEPPLAAPAAVCYELKLISDVELV